jgi:hypothetical protein
MYTKGAGSSYRVAAAIHVERVQPLRFGELLANSAATIAAIGHYTRLDMISGQFLSLDVAIKYIEYQLIILKSAA